jgi:hypothetical protein
VIKTEPGFTAKILVPPGQLYAPFAHDGAVWFADGGGEEDGIGSRVMAVSPKGKVTVIVPL